MFGYTLEEIVKIIKIRSAAALNFWSVVSLTIYGLAFVALGYRIADLAEKHNKHAMRYRLLSFQVLS